jgi:hypothetical protein
MRIILVLLFFIVINSQIVTTPPQDINLGIHVHGSVSGQADSYSQFYLPQIPELSDVNHLVFTVTPLSGDVDLFISKNGNATNTNFNWKTQLTGGIISYVNKSQGATTGPYWISVLGSTPAHFTIAVYIDDGKCHL